MTKNSEIYGGIKYDVESRTILKTDSIVDSIIDEHISRAEMGKKKYNNTMDRTDLSVTVIFPVNRVPSFSSTPSIPETSSTGTLY